MATGELESLDAQFEVIEPIDPTDFSVFITEVLARHLRDGEPSKGIDQKVLRQCVDLASSFLVTDTATNPERGILTWSTGFNRLVDLVLVLHKRDELELETVSAASRACSECWTVAGNWRGFDECRNTVREIGGKLKMILDENERTYRGERVYAP